MGYLLSPCIGSVIAPELIESVLSCFWFTGQPKSALERFPLRMKPLSHLGYLLASSVPLLYCFLSFLSIPIQQLFLSCKWCLLKLFFSFLWLLFNISLFHVSSDNQLLFFLTKTGLYTPFFDIFWFVIWDSSNINCCFSDHVFLLLELH